ncbi:MAG: transposase [Hyphomicrobiaceae bacterium]|nr:transposase [Hyphomicrobiaceae bacterium]
MMHPCVVFCWTSCNPGQFVLADKAYDADWIRNMIWEQGAIDVIPSKSNRKIPKEFDAELYKQRNHVERCIGRLKASFRRIATRYEKTPTNFMAMIKLAAVRLWCRFMRPLPGFWCSPHQKSTWGDGAGFPSHLYL